MFGDFMVHTNRIYIPTTFNRYKCHLGPFLDNGFKRSSMYCHFIAINFLKRDGILTTIDIFRPNVCL